MTQLERDRQDGSAGKWIADKIAKHDNVASVTLVAPNKMHVRRKKWDDVPAFFIPFFLSTCLVFQ